MDQTEARFGYRRNRAEERNASSTAEAKAALRNEIGRLCDELNAHLPQYWRSVEPRQYRDHRDALLALGLCADDRSLSVAALEQLRGELAGLEHTCRRVLSEPPRRQMRRMFI